MCDITRREVGRLEVSSIDAPGLLSEKKNPTVSWMKLNSPVGKVDGISVSAGALIQSSTS